MTLTERGAPRDELESVGRTAVVAIVERHVLRCCRVVGPQFDGTSVRFVVTAEDDQHRGEKVAGKHGQRDAAGQAFGVRGLGAAEVRTCELFQYDRPAFQPSLARQAFAEAEAHLPAGGAKALCAAVQASAELERAAVVAGHPDFDDADEGLLAGDDGGVHLMQPFRRGCAACRGSR
ncbi:MAG: hypothetical protein AW07_02385 [Candidatus Accumulibacter sp. SK-11]|nr:MAG: hypothetical protein AW07_02385 [Candidatus Accumulibacter sp. SK-11]